MRDSSEKRISPISSSSSLTSCFILKQNVNRLLLSIHGFAEAYIALQAMVCLQNDAHRNFKLQNEVCLMPVTEDNLDMELFLTELIIQL